MLFTILHIYCIRILYILNPTNNYDYSEFKVENMEELQRVRNELLTKPILFHIKVEHNKTEHYVVMKVRKVWRGLFTHCFVVVCCIWKIMQQSGGPIADLNSSIMFELSCLKYSEFSPMAFSSLLHVVLSFKYMY